MRPVEEYLKTLSEIRRTGGATPETSYYAALETLLNEVGANLKPKVRAVAQLADTGAGSPDFGLFTATQFQRAKDHSPPKGATPERGVVEVKGWADDSFVTAQTPQVSKYWKHYGLVLVTNYRDFVLLGRDEEGRPLRLETYRLAESEADFRALLSHPRQAADAQGERLMEFLRRVLLYEAALTDPERLAWFLASYAREARHRVEAKADDLALGALKKALEEALGMTFEGDKGEHFFQASFVQTLFYGIFSSWVLWSRDQGSTGFQPVNHDQGGRAASGPRFDWRHAAWTLHVPMVKSLFDQIATPTQLKPLGVDEVLDWAGAALNRVDRVAFFAKFEEEYAVQYFYEPFLQAYDPELRKELGVWYTPPEIVRYQVERVDRVLREELNLPDGLADERVVVLDPCCGTGAYLVETLKRIHRTLEEQGGSALTAQKLKRAAMKRVFGFEILPAPFVVAHLQLGLMLRLLGAPLDHDSDQRAGVYLTNALTGWEPLEKPKDELPLFHELMEERDAANRVKQEAPILVILGNPPYNAFAGTSPEEEGGLVDVYKEGLTTPVKQGGWGIKKFNLDDLYVRFFRIAERRIAKSGKGVVSFISNYSWTSEPSFVVLRKRLLESFDKFWIENMHGNRKISEYAPDGRTSETVFAIPGFSAGIRQGVVVSLWVRRGDRDDSERTVAKVLYRDDLDAARALDRRRDLLASLKAKAFDRRYKVARPAPDNRFSFRPAKSMKEYRAWPRVTDLCAVPPSNGLMEKRGGALMDIDRKTLETRMRTYFNPELAWRDTEPLVGNLAIPAAGYDPEETRRKAMTKEHFDVGRMRRYALRPFDTVWCYYSPVASLWNRSRPSFHAQTREGNAFFMTRPAGVANPEGVPVCFARILGDNDFQRGHAYYFPIRLRSTSEDGHGKKNHQPSVFEEFEPYGLDRANLSATARAYLAQLGFGDPDMWHGHPGHESRAGSPCHEAALIWMHALAIGYSPAYLDENADGIRQDWPRVPLPATKKNLLDSAALGRRVAALLDTETPVEGVTHGKLDPRLKPLGAIRKVGGGALDPDAGELDVTAGWGHGGRGGVRMPGRGKIVERHIMDKEYVKFFGLAALDVYLNDVAYWENVPRAVWDFTLGGYQVIKKWLSYREKSMLGRGLTMEEADYVTEMVRRLAALILLRGDLDANYEAVKTDTWPWPGA